MSDDDPTQWFRPRPARDGDTPADAPPPDGAGGTSAEPPATEQMSAAETAAVAEDTPATQAIDRDGLGDLFGDQRDYAEESSWLPAGSERGADAPTTAYSAQQPETDPIGWLGAGNAAVTPDPAATTVAFGAAGGTAGAAAGAIADASVTQRFTQSPTASGPVTGSGDEPPTGPNRTLIILAIVGGVLVIGIVVALIVLFTSGAAKPSASGSARPSQSSSPSSSPSASPSPSSTPSTSPTPTTAPPTPAATIGSFSASPSSPPCTATTGTVTVSFSWSTSNAAKVSLSIDGVADPYNDQLSAAGTLSNVPYDCSKASQGYTLTAANAKGVQTSKPITLVRPTIAPPSPTPTPGDSGTDDD